MTGMNNSTILRIYTYTGQREIEQRPKANKDKWILSVLCGRPLRRATCAPMPPSWNGWGNKKAATDSAQNHDLR